LTFLNFPLSEWATLITILGSLVGIIVWALKESIVKPMEKSNQNLQDTIHSLKQLVDNINTNAATKHDEFDKRLDDHQDQLSRHDEKIKTLFERTHDHEQ